MFAVGVMKTSCGEDESTEDKAIGTYSITTVEKSNNCGASFETVADDLAEIKRDDSGLLILDLGQGGQLSGTIQDSGTLLFIGEFEADSCTGTAKLAGTYIDGTISGEFSYDYHCGTAGSCSIVFSTTAFQHR